MNGCSTLGKIFRIDIYFLPFKLQLLLLSFAAINAKYINFETQRAIGTCTVYTRVQVEFFGRENGLKKSTSTYIRENMRHTYRITKKCQNSLQQAKLRS